MKNIHHNEKFFRKLGYAFYSVAASDGTVAEDERKMLHQMVIEDWVTLELSQDEFGSDAAYQIEMLFEYLTEQAMGSEKAFQKFEQYFKDNLELFSDDVIDRIYHTANRIADSFHSKNKAELNTLMRLHLLLGKERHIL